MYISETRLLPQPIIVYERNDYLLQFFVRSSMTALRSDIHREAMKSVACLGVERTSMHRRRHGQMLSGRSFGGELVVPTSLLLPTTSYYFLLLQTIEHNVDTTLSAVAILINPTAHGLHDRLKCMSVLRGRTTFNGLADQL